MDGIDNYIVFIYLQMKRMYSVIVGITLLLHTYNKYILQLKKNN